MKEIFLIILMTIVFGGATKAQTIFEDDFETYSNGDNLTEKGYEISKSATYSSAVTAIIDSVIGNKYVKLHASENGQARMQFLKSVNLTPGVTYTFEIQTKGVFKRFLQLLPADGGNYLSKTPDFTPTEEQKTQWITHTLSYTPAAGEENLKLGILHNWSGTLQIDNIKVQQNLRLPIISAVLKVMIITKVQLFHPGKLYRKLVRLDCCRVIRFFSKKETVLTDILRLTARAQKKFQL